MRFNIVPIVIVILFVSSFAKVQHPKNFYRLEMNANPHQEGDAFEWGVITPSLFKLKTNSRHYWSLFSTVGFQTIYNAVPKDANKAKQQIINYEFITGIAASGTFYKDFIYQYGKIGASFFLYDPSIRKNYSIAPILESGVEFKSSVVPLSFHTGFRWRIAFPTSANVLNEPDLFEGISIVLGYRYFI